MVYTKRLEKIYSMASITDHRSARHRPIYFTPTQALKGYSTRRKCTQLRLFLKTEKQLQTCGSSRVKILMFFHCYRAKDTVGFLAKLGINSGISVRRITWLQKSRESSCDLLHSSSYFSMPVQENNNPVISLSALDYEPARG